MGQSPKGSVIPISRAAIMKGGLIADRIDETPVHVEGVVQITGEVTAESHESLEEELLNQRMMSCVIR